MPDIDPNNNLDQFEWDFCPRSFTSKRGKGVHERSQHPVQANEQILARIDSCSVVPEEMELFTAAEAEVEPRNENYMKNDLMGVFEKSNTVELNQLKNIRRIDYRQIVTQTVQALTAAAVEVPAASSIEDEEDNEQQFFRAESDDDVTEGSLLVARSPLILCCTVPEVPY